MHRELLAEGRRRAVDESLKRTTLFRSAVSFLFLAAFVVACSFAPSTPTPDGGKVDSGVQPTSDSGVRIDGGLSPTEACLVLNDSRCAYLARCGLIANDAQSRQECARYFEATWCGPMTWPSHVAAGALKFEPARAEACAASFDTQVCGEWTTLPDSCNRFLVPRVPLYADCYDGYTECADGVCRGSSCPRTCLPRALINDPCSVDGDCKNGLFCKLSPFTPNAGECTAFGTNGTACDSSRECLEGLQCINQQCRILPVPGAPCVEGFCSEQGFCDGLGDAGLCVSRKQEGATCLEGECQAALVCDPLRAVCVKIRISSGDLCSLAQQCPPGEVCLGASNQVAGLCHAPQPEGDPCLTHADCEAHLACQDADGGRVCQRRAAAGATCDSTQTCWAGSVCAASTCTSLPLPGESCAETRECRWGLCRELANVDGGAVCGALLSAAQPCQRPEECASGSCVGGTCSARCVP